MTNTTRLLTITMLLSELLSSCTMESYMPNQHNVPLFRERGEVRVVAAKANAGMISEPAQLPRATFLTVVDRAPEHDLQVAVAVADHIGVMANAAWFKMEGRSQQARGRILELGAGYFHKLGGHGVLEGYAGVGVLRSRHDHGTGRYAEARFVRPFVQPIIGYASRNFDMALSTRLAWLHCTSRDAYGTFDPHEVQRVIPIGDARLLVEPMALFRFGSRSLKLQLQFGYSLCQGEEFSRVEKTFGAGFQVNINNAFRRKAMGPNQS